MEQDELRISSESVIQKGGPVIPYVSPFAKRERAPPTIGNKRRST